MRHFYIKSGINSLRPRQNGRHFADDIFKCILLNENVWIPIKISPKFVPQGPINNIPALVQIMAWRRPGDKPLSGPMMVRLPTHICGTRPQWVKIMLVYQQSVLINWFYWTQKLFQFNMSYPFQYCVNCHLTNKIFLRLTFKFNWQYKSTGLGKALVLIWQQSI